MSRTASEVVEAYFAAIKGRDLEAIRDLFHPDADLVSGMGTTHGRDAITAWYDDVFRNSRPMPDPGEPIELDERVAVEIELDMGGSRSLVADFFTIAEGQITRLAIYSGPQLD